jgi:predicted dehydrogenase
MKILLIGYGSIAKKHLSALNKLIECQVFAYRSEFQNESEPGITNVYNINDVAEVDFIIISNPTYLHAKSIQEVISLKKPIFLEKPPFSQLGRIELQIIDALKTSHIPVYCAFNMRYLDTLKYLKNNLDLSKVQEVNIYCGSYLPEWRPGVNYKKNYSAIAAQGGGVHLDLIHEIDYALWIFGEPNHVTAIKRSCSNLDIDAIDYAYFTLEYDRFVVNINLNYYRRDVKREVEVVMEDKTIVANLTKNEIVELNNNNIIFQSENNVIDTYTSQMRYFLNLLEMGFDTNRSFEDSITALKIALI